MNTVRVRRWGFGVIHSALFPSGLIRASTVWGAPVRVVDGPIVARCGAVLRGQLVVMDSPVDCRTCKALED